MNNQELLYKSFADALQIEESIISDDLKYQSIVEWDSIAHMVLINEIETNFNLIIETDDVIDMSSVSKAKEILSKYNINF
jgi:acyl carrier protein